MVDADRSYFHYRARVEIERAQGATIPEVVWAHSQLAEAYLGRLAASEDDSSGSAESGWDD